MTKNVTKITTTALLAAWLPVASAQIIFSAPPREKPEVGQKIYGPLAAYLSSVTGKKVVYQHPGDWKNYRNSLQRDKFDLVFDGPHLVSWRMSYKKHRPLAALPGQLSFVVIVRGNKLRYKDLADLAGKKVCGFDAPNLATLTMLNKFESRDKPRLIKIRSFPDGYKKLLAGNCDAAVMRDKMYYELDKDDGKTRIVYLSSSLPNQAFTAGKRLNKRDKRKIASALTSSRARGAAGKFHKKYTRGKRLLKAQPFNYEGLDELLEDVKGFDS